MVVLRLATTTTYLLGNRRQPLPFEPLRVPLRVLLLLLAYLHKERPLSAAATAQALRLLELQNKSRKIFTEFCLYFGGEKMPVSRASNWAQFHKAVKQKILLCWSLKGFMHKRMHKMLQTLKGRIYIQRPVSSLGVSQNMHKITNNMGKFWLNYTLPLNHA